MSNTEQETKITDLLERDGVVTAEKVEKPYTLRKLNSKDISPMIKVLKKIDLKKLKESIQESNLMDVVSNKIKTVSNDENVENVENEETKENNTNELIKIGGALIFDAIPILLDAVDNAIDDINKLLAGVAGLEVEEVENMDLDVYFNLIYDFITKPEFEGFIKAVSKLMK